MIFDFGRVISAQKPRSLFAAYEKALGLAPDTLNPIMFDTPHWEAVCLGRIGIDDYWRAVGPALGLLSPGAIDAFRHRYRADEALDPQVLATLRRLHGRCRLAVLSNNPPGLAQWLADWGILGMFDVVFCSGDEGVMKPDPEAFHQTLARLKTPPGAAIFIDDTLRHVRAARRLGLHAIHFTTAGRLNRELSLLLPE